MPSMGKQFKKVISFQEEGFLERLTLKMKASERGEIIAKCVTFQNI
jgi:hypothetical protein